MVILKALGLSCASASIAIIVKLYVTSLVPVTVPDSNPVEDNVNPVGKVLPEAKVYVVADIAANWILMAISLLLSCRMLLYNYYRLQLYQRS